MSYRGRSCKRISTSGLIHQLLRSVEKGLLQEVSRGRSTRKLERTEQFIVFKYTKIMLINNQHVISKKV